MSVLTVDIAVVAEGNILLIQRAKPPFMDKLVLPGGHFESDDENLAHAACRELEEEVGLRVEAESLHQITILDSMNRDPRGRKVSVVFLLKLDSLDRLQGCKAGSDAQKIIIREINSIQSDEIGFDHWAVIHLLKGE